MSKKYYDAMDQDTISLDEMNEVVCPVCNCTVYSDSVVTDCREESCPYEPIDAFYLDDVQELDFND